MSTVTMYATATCPYCIRARQILQARGVSEIDEIREKGFTAWAHDKKMEALRKRIEDEILAQRGLTEEGVAALPEADRTTVETEIARLIEERLQQTMEAQVEEAAQGGKTEGVLLNIMV